MNGDPSPLLRVQPLSVALPPGSDRHEAVSDANLELRANEIVCVVGESGSGKSMLASAVMGLLPTGVRVSGGRILLGESDLLQLSPAAMRSIRGRQVGMVFQDPMTGLNPLLRVGDQVEEVLLVHGQRDRRLRRREALKMLAEVGMPDPELIYRTHPFRLSGGQRQRVMIAIALILRPGVLIADEPTSALDVTTQMTILRLLRTLQAERGMGVLFITHDFGVVAEIADRVVVMRHGQLVESGHVVDVLHRPQHPYTRTLIAGLRRERDARDRSVLTPAQPILQVRSVSKLFRRGVGLFRRGRSICAVDAAELVLHRGETLGLVGESGSGKSTLARCVVRLLDVTEGSIRFREMELATLAESEMRKVRSGIQMIFQDPYASLNPRQRVLDIIADGPAAHGVDRSEARAHARSLLRRVGLGEKAAERFPHEFSGGQRQRIGIARALALRPELLVCDEPVSALDVTVQAQILDLLAEIRHEFGLSMLFITHDLRVAARVCDRVAVMKGGRIVEIGGVAEVFGSPRHAYTKELIAALPGSHVLPAPRTHSPVHAAQHGKR